MKATRTKGKQRVPGRKSVQTIGIPKGASRKVSNDADAHSEALGPRKGRGGQHGVPSGFYARKADPEAKQAAEEMRVYFRTVIKMIMESQDMTQAELAGRMGIGLGTLKDRLAGRAKIGIGEANQIATILGVPLHVLVDPNAPMSELMQLKPRYPTQGCFSPTTVGSVTAYSGPVGDSNGIAVGWVD